MKIDQATLAELVADPFFRKCLGAAIQNRQLIAEFDRLYGYNLSRSGTGFDLAIDDSSGRTEAALADFVRFVHECIFQRLSRAE